MPLLPAPLRAEPLVGPNLLLSLPFTATVLSDPKIADQIANTLQRGVEGLERLQTWSSGGHSGHNLNTVDNRSETSGTPLTIEIESTAQFGPEADESSTIEIDDSGIRITAQTLAGGQYALESIHQLVRTALDTGEKSLTPQRIEDAPRFKWRGLSVDVARTFHGPETLRRIIEVMAQQKLNVLHLHLTDDQGWRLEMPSRPELTAASSGTSVVPGHSGFLTTADYEDLQIYAAERSIVVVPEIDVPGHTNAALHAYAELNADGVAPEVYTGDEVGFSQLFTANPATEPFLRDVIGDVARMTHGAWLHFGGDECLSMDSREYVVLVSLAERIVREAGKQPIGWQEITAAPIEADTIAQFWDGRKGAPVGFREAFARGNQFIASPSPQAYLDARYNTECDFGVDWAGVADVEDSYGWEPTEVIGHAVGVFAAEDVAQVEAAIFGIEATIWTETIAGPEAMFRLLLPRLAALAEVSWSPQGTKDWESFRTRIAAQGPRWREAGLNYFESSQVDWE